MSATKTALQSYRYEYTDTFGGEANYAWCRRGTVSAKTDMGAVRAVKSELGLTGCRCAREDWGDTIVLRPSGSCTIVFIEWCETPAESAE